MPKIVFVLFLWGMAFVNPCLSNPFEKDSTRKAKVPDADIEALWAAAGKAASDSFALAQEYLSEALRLSKKRRNAYTEALTYSAMGELHRHFGQSPPVKWEAMHYFAQASERLLQQKDTLELARNGLRTGLLLKEFGEQEQATTELLKAAKLLELMGAQTDLSRAFFELADLFRQSGDLKLAMDYGVKANEAARKSDPSPHQMAIHNLLGEVLLNLDRGPAALEYFREALQQARGDTRLEIQVLNNLGQVFLKEMALDSSQLHFAEALSEANEIQDLTGQATGLIGLGMVAARLSNPDAAIAWLDSALRVSRRAHCGECLSKVYRELASAYRAAQNPEFAFQYMNQLLLLQDSLAMNQRVQDTYRIEAMYQSQAREEENLRLQAEKAVDAVRQQVMALVGVLLLVLVLFFYVQYRSKKRLNKRLNMLVEKRTEQLRSAYAEVIDLNRELDIFAYRTAHDIRGPVARLLGLSELVLAVNIKNDQAARYMRLIYAEAKNMDFMLFRFMEVNHIKHLSEAASLIHIGEMIQRIFQSIRDRNLDGVEEVGLLTDLPENPWLRTRSGLLEIALRNLFENSITYRATSGPRIHITITRDNEQWRIRVWDNGQGISKEAEERIFQMFFRGTHVSKGLGLGLYTARLAVEKIGGSLNLIRTEPGNTEFEILLPNLKA